MKIALLSRKKDCTYVRISIKDDASDTFKKCMATEGVIEVVDIGSSEEMDEVERRVTMVRQIHSS